ncbi:DUF421 domain-containing protein [Leisingera caerulea]|uniref:DUF421 domain-containing protein n=1 Tax=Leisingera caerulea TaxID=506591 RepID=A0A9Q9HEB4_LEICA|nr:YetF domain-containing protein [Leisingera caerulea]UWQ53208.1 DUF421 domain-containing protein [Leisingera caerulea]
MIFENLLLDVLFRAVLLSALAVSWIIFLVRIIGLRTFSKMNSFDFVVTVATGSLLAGASQATDWPGFFQSATAIATLLGVQFVVALLRIRSGTVESIIQNDPVLLMRDGVILEAALTATRVAESDLIAKLREANVKDLSQVRAVVLETTGDISVLHGDHLQDRLLSGVEKG